MRSSILKFMAAGLAAASMGVVAAPSYAGVSTETANPSNQAWCDVVPPFCGCNNNVSARCRPGPCQVVAPGVRDRNDQSLCATKTED